MQCHKQQYYLNVNNVPKGCFNLYLDVYNHLFLFFLSKCAELEEELKNVTNNLKSLEAQAEKVGSGYRFQNSMAQLFLFFLQLC